MSRSTNSLLEMPSEPTLKLVRQPLAEPSLRSSSQLPRKFIPYHQLVDPLERTWKVVFLRLLMSFLLAQSGLRRSSMKRWCQPLRRRAASWPNLEMEGR